MGVSAMRLATIIIIGAICGMLLAIPATAAQDERLSWEQLRTDFFGTRPIEDGASVVALDVPIRPQDAGLVPLAITVLDPRPERRPVTLTLIVDRNPIPLAGVFRLAPEAGISRIETRIRIDQYSDVRVIAETADGRLAMASRFVKATGGCSAPAVAGSGPDTRLGEIRLRQYVLTPDAANPARMPTSRALIVQVRHPNHSGFQRDPLAGHFIPAHYVSTIVVRQGATPLISAEGAISFSENPSIRFDYVPKSDAAIAVEAEDTEGSKFTKSWESKEILPEGAGSPNN
jgi:sulfur-oxidizing protein SoxY